MVELDGGQHQVSIEYYAERTNYLDQRGFSALRFWNNQVFSEISGVKEAIRLALAR